MAEPAPKNNSVYDNESDDQFLSAQERAKQNWGNDDAGALKDQEENPDGPATTDADNEESGALANHGDGEEDESGPSKLPWKQQVKNTALHGLGARNRGAGEGKKGSATGEDEAAGEAGSKPSLKDKAKFAAVHGAGALGEDGFWKGAEGKKGAALNGVGGGLKKWKKRLAVGAMGVGGLGLVGVILFVLFFLSSLKSVHFATVLRSAGFAQFNLYMREQAARTTFNAAVLTDESTGKFPELEDRSLLDKLRRVNPEKQLEQLAREDTMKFDFEGEAKWGGLKTVNNFKGVEINGEKINLDEIAQKYGYQTYNELTTGLNRVRPGAIKARLQVEGEFVNTVRDGLAERLAMEGRSFRSSVYDGLRQASGIRFWKWLADAKEKFSGESTQEAAKSDLETNKETIDAGSGEPTSGLDELKNEAEEVVKEDDAAIAAGKKPPLVDSELANRLRGSLGDISTAVLVTTVGCVIHDLHNSFDAENNARERERRADRFGHDGLTTASQIQDGKNVVGEEVGAENARWDDAELAAHYKEDTGQTLTEADQKQKAATPSVKPPSVPFANVIGTIDDAITGIIPGSNLPGIKQIVKGSENAACNVLLNKYTQGTLAVGEIFLSVTGETEVSAAIRKGLEESLKLAGTVGLGELAGQFIENAVRSYANTDFSATTTNEAKYNQGHVTIDLLQETGNRQIAFSAPMTDQQGVESKANAMEVLRAEYSKKPIGERYFAIDNPFSLIGKLSAIVPSSKTEIFGLIGRGLASMISNALNFFVRLPQLIGSLFTSHSFAYAAAANETQPNFYGVDQWGWTKAERDKVATDPAFEPLALTQWYSDNQKDPDFQKYQACYTYVLQVDKPKQDGHDICTHDFLTTDKALKWREYQAESYEADRLSEDLNAPETTVDSTFGGTNIVSGDTSAMTCQVGSDAGVGDGYQGGKLYKIRLCNVQGVIVNAQIALNFNNMIIAANGAARGGVGGGFRTMEQQQNLRVAHGCPDPSTPSTQCNPPTARPGYSNHQMGLAIDFANCGSHSTACWQWLTANAAQYGFYNLPSEPWHWSVNGK